MKVLLLVPWLFVMTRLPRVTTTFRTAREKVGNNNNLSNRIINIVGNSI